MAKILFVGSFDFAWYEEACALGLEALGHKVDRFSWRNYYKNFIHKIETHLTLPGPAMLRINRDIIKLAKQTAPDIVLIWRGVNILPRTLQQLKRELGVKLVSYNLDDPFSPHYDNSSSMHLKRIWRYFQATIPDYDYNFVVRKHNVEEYLRAGAKHVQVLRQYYVPHIHYPIPLSPEDLARYQSDIVFVGHYEDDGRIDYLRALIKAGIKLRLYGSNWSAQILGDLDNILGPVFPVFLEEYTKIICSAKICLAFVSKLNRDYYTSRTFEIPACRSVLLSERTIEMPLLYQEDREALFFSSPAEMLEKAKRLLANEDERLSIAEAGYRRCLADGHDSISRMREMMREVGE